MAKNVRLIYSQIPCVCRKNVTIDTSYFPLFQEIITRNLLLLISTSISKILPKVVLVLTMFIQRADNLAKLIGIRITVTSANWEHNVQLVTILRGDFDKFNAPLI